MSCLVNLVQLLQKVMYAWVRKKQIAKRHLRSFPLFRGWSLEIPPHPQIPFFSFNQDGWHSAVQDQLILSNADIIMAATTSSFTQSLPLSLATGRVQYPDSPHNHPPRRVFLKKPFCEGVPPFMTCFQSVGDWCCNTRDKKPTYHDVTPSWRQWV